MDTFPMELTPGEILYLSDHLSMFGQGPPDALPGQNSPYPQLLTKICSALLETVSTEKPTTVRMELSELWIIREVAKSNVMVGHEQVGLQLVGKVCAGILGLTANEYVEEAVKQWGEVAEDELSFEQAQATKTKGGGPNDESNNNPG
ncbi:MAG TPA: hypothetical protein VFE94_04125 [Candidatus Paceibacterota bacterium]|nr:hypothetical protein [Candidatus Paceibacterota bacterium]